MVSLKLQKRLASSVLKCGRGKVWLDPNETNEISMANSRQNIRKVRVAGTTTTTATTPLCYRGRRLALSTQITHYRGATTRPPACLASTHLPSSSLPQPPPLPPSTMLTPLSTTLHAVFAVRLGSDDPVSPCPTCTDARRSPVNAHRSDAARRIGAFVQSYTRTLFPSLAWHYSSSRMAS